MNVGVESLEYLKRPFTFIESESAPECREILRWPDDTDHQKRFEVRLLGRRPGRLKYEGGYDRLPEKRVYRLSGVMMFNSLTFSQKGVFPESLRYRASTEAPVPGFSLPRFNPRLVEGCRRRYAFQELPAEGLDPVHIDEPCLPFHTVHEYGHYLTEALPFLWYLPYLPQGVRLAISPEAKAVPPYLPELTKPFGLTEKDFIIPGRVSVFRELYLPGRLYMEGQYQSRAAREIYGKISSHHAAADAGSRAGSEKLYVSRQGLAKRRLVNEGRAEEIFRERGFVVIHPEELPVAEQVRLFAGARAVAGPVGSGLHNVFFSAAPERLKTLILAPEGFAANKSFFQAERAAGRQPACVYGRYLDSSVPRTPRRTYDADWTIDPADLSAALNQWIGPEGY